MSKYFEKSLLELLRELGDVSRNKSGDVLKGCRMSQCWLMLEIICPRSQTHTPLLISSFAHPWLLSSPHILVPPLSKAGSDTRREESRHPRSQSLILKQLQWNVVCVSHLHHLSIVLSWSNTELHIICHRMDFPLIYFTMWHNVT